MKSNLRKWGSGLFWTGISISGIALLILFTMISSEQIERASLGFILLIVGVFFITIAKILTLISSYVKTDNKIKKNNKLIGISSNDLLEELTNHRQEYSQDAIELMESELQCRGVNLPFVSNNEESVLPAINYATDKSEIDAQQDDNSQKNTVISQSVSLDNADDLNNGNKVSEMKLAKAYGDKKTGRNCFWFGILLLLLTMIASAFNFIAVPFLVMGLFFTPLGVYFYFKAKKNIVETQNEMKNPSDYNNR